MRRAAVVLPFAFGSLALRCSVAPLGDAMARGVIAVAPPPPARESAPVVVVPKPAIEAGVDVADEATGPIPVVPPEHHEVRRRAEVEPRDAAPPPPAPRAFVVPATAVARALEHRDVGAVNAVAPDGTPVGARLVGVGKYGTGLRDGDIVVSVAGSRTPTVDAMVSAAMGAVSGGATRIGGHVIRGDATFGVILELPPR